MESQVVDAGSTRKDALLLVVAAALFVGGLFAFYYFDPQLATVVRLLILLAAFGAAGAIGYQTAMGRDVWSAVSGARTELRKVIWPNRKQMVSYTSVVLAFLVFMVTLIGLVEMMGNMEDTAAIGQGMATALIGTLYGAIAANVLFGPLASKMKNNTTLEVQYREMVIEGLRAISRGESARNIQDSMVCVLPPVQQTKFQAA